MFFPHLDGPGLHAGICRWRGLALPHLLRYLLEGSGLAGNLGTVGAPAEPGTRSAK
jgi:hypothetical protein